MLELLYIIGFLIVFAIVNKLVGGGLWKAAGKGLAALGLGMLATKPDCEVGKRRIYAYSDIGKVGRIPRPMGWDEDE